MSYKQELNRVFSAIQNLEDAIYDSEELCDGPEGVFGWVSELDETHQRFVNDPVIREYSEKWAALEKSVSAVKQNALAFDGVLTKAEERENALVGEIIENMDAWSDFMYPSDWEIKDGIVYRARMSSFKDNMAELDVETVNEFIKENLDRLADEDEIEDAA